jgi:hypothetical protein
MEQGLLGQALLCAALLCAAALPWRETSAAASEGRRSSVNKVHFLIFFRVWVEMGFLCSCRHGGVRAEETSFSACVWVGVWASSSVLSPLLHGGAHHMANKLVAMIRGLDVGHFSRCLVSVSTTSLLEALKKILTGATHLPVAKWFRPRQQVAGGRHRGLIAGGEDSLKQEG